ncbi:MAG: hypothetical protein HY394_05335 [Candidatus Diapherotrites archaeon]|nr:hypothetical protein [Candidatus Diapherotrites archaeon]
MKNLLTIEEEFKTFIENCNSGEYKNILDVPPHIWGLHGWEQTPKKKIEEILLPFINQNIERAKKFMPIYKNAYAGTNPKKIETIEDFWQIPALIKDSGNYGIGFREKVRKNPYVMLPTDIKEPTYVFRSGGTKGVATPTMVTKFDIEVESHGFARGYRYEGMKPGDIAMSTYNPTHKGGECIKESFIKNGMTYIPRRTTDPPKEVIDIIEAYKINVLLTVQGPVERGDNEQKGGAGGLDLFSLIEANSDIIEKNIDIIFLGGYRLIDEAITWAENANKPLVTLLGSSEAIPQATSTGLGPKDRLCKFNNLHVLHGPHYIEVLKEESGTLVPVKKGETGLLAYTTVARQGTLYIRYFPGDAATLLAKEKECNCGIKSEIITDVNRIDHPEDVVSTGCCIG